MSKFESRLSILNSIEALKFKEPIINVLDTVETVKIWFDEYNIEYTASDLISTASLILGQMQHER